MTGAMVTWRAVGVFAISFVDHSETGGAAIPADGYIPWMTILAFIAIVLFVVGVWYMTRTVRNWTGSDQVSQWASHHNMRYNQRNDSLSLNWAEKPFGYSARTCYNVVVGKYRDHNTTLFDLGDFSTSSHASGMAFSHNSDVQEQIHGHVASVVVMDLPFSIDTDITLQPMKGISKLWARDSGGDHVELENEDFNRRYEVICNDRELVYSFLTARTIDVLNSQPPVEIRVRGMQVLLLDDGPLRPDRMNRWLAMLSAVVENVEPYVWTDRGNQAVAELELQDKNLTPPQD